MAQLRALGYGQGYYFSPPLDAQMADHLLARQSPNHRAITVS